MYTVIFIYILNAYGIPDEIIGAIMIAYTNTKSIMRTDDGDTDFINISGGVLQGDTLAPFLFIICLDYVLKKTLDRNNDIGFTLIERRRKRYPAIQITDVDYADDLDIVTDKTNEAIILLHTIEKAAKEIGLSINTEKTKFISINQVINEVIKSLNGKNIKEISDVKYLGSYIQSTEKYINIILAKSWAALNEMNSIWKCRLPDNMKRNFFRVTVESVLIYGSVSWTLTKSLEKDPMEIILECCVPSYTYLGNIIQTIKRYSGHLHVDNCLCGSVAKASNTQAVGHELDPRPDN